MAENLSRKLWKFGKTIRVEEKKMNEITWKFLSLLFSAGPEYGNYETATEWYATQIEKKNTCIC